MPIFVNDKSLETFNFYGGECHVKINTSDINHTTEVLAYLHTSNDIMCLLLTIDAIRRVYSTTTINLTIPYFPYARQDRVCNAGESLSVKVMADMINHLNCASVIIYDPHSDVTSALLNHCKVISLADIVVNSALAQEIVTNSLALVSPDAGAEKKIREAGKRLSTASRKIPVFTASKVRDTLTGEIVSTEMHENVEGKDLIILDDICDGGRTFIELAKVLHHHGARNIFLYVTHGIFSQGLDVLKIHFKRVFCYHTMLQRHDIDTDFLTILGDK